MYGKNLLTFSHINPLSISKSLNCYQILYFNATDLVSLHGHWSCRMSAFFNHLSVRVHRTNSHMERTDVHDVLLCWELRMNSSGSSIFSRSKQS